MPPLLLRAIVAALPLVSADALAEPHMMGLGGQTCGAWTANPPATSGVGAFYQQWVLGFLSGVSFADPDHDPLNDSDGAAITTWLNDYCQQNPAARLVDATTAFVRAHQPTKN